VLNFEEIIDLIYFFLDLRPFLNKKKHKQLLNKHLIFSIHLIFMTLISIGQSKEIEVSPANENINEKSVKGFVVCLELDAKTVSSSWSKYLKSLGKFEVLDKQTMQGLNLSLPNVSNDAVDFYSKITVSPRCIQIFMAAQRAGSNLDLPESQKENIRKMVYDFGIEQYRQDLIKQMTEAERVVSLAVKAHDKRINEGQNLKNKLVRNRKEKQKLLQNLEDNIQNLKKLQADSVQNVSEQETALEEITKVRTIAEEKKLKLSQVR